MVQPAPFSHWLGKYPPAPHPPCSNWFTRAHPLAAGPNFIEDTLSLKPTSVRLKQVSAGVRSKAMQTARPPKSPCSYSSRSRPTGLQGEHTCAPKLMLFDGVTQKRRYFRLSPGVSSQPRDVLRLTA